MGLTWPGLLSLHEMGMNGTHDRAQESRQGGLSMGSQLGGGQDGAANPVALMRSKGRRSRDMHERGAGETGCRVDIGAGVVNGSVLMLRAMGSQLKTSVRA